MTTPREEDRAAELARQLNQAGIEADPGVLGGVVIYATAGQAEQILAGLVPAAAEGPGWYASPDEATFSRLMAAGWLAYKVGADGRPYSIHSFTPGALVVRPMLTRAEYETRKRNEQETRS